MAGFGRVLLFGLVTCLFSTSGHEHSWGTTPLVSLQSKSIVVIQLGGIQSWWCEEVFQAVEEVILSNNAPVTIGLIGQGLDSHVEFDLYLTQLSQNSLVEIASNSFSFTSYTSQSLESQKLDIEIAQTMIKKVTSETPKILIPPPGTEYNRNTILALKSVDHIHALSPPCIYVNDTIIECYRGSDVSAPSMTWEGVFMLPVGAVLGNITYWQDFSLPASLLDAVGWIENQIRRQGFSVLQLQAPEFSIGGQCTALDMDKLSVLTELLQYGKERWSFQTSSDALEILTRGEYTTGGPSRYPSATPRPSPAPTPVTAPITSDFVPETNVVMIRIDDVSAGWCESMGMTAIDAVLSEGVPINVGIIGNGLVKGAPLAAFLENRAKRNDVEIVSHSFQHSKFPNFQLEWQLNDLVMGQDIIGRFTGIRPSAFIPPQNEYSADTLTAMQRSGDLLIMSAECLWSLDDPGTTLYCPPGSDVVAPNLKVNGVYMLPAGAVLGGQEYWTHYQLPASVQDAVGWVEQQIANQGFSVIMLHPVEFSTSSECVTLDNIKIQVLQDIIRYGIANGWKFKTFREATEALTGYELPPMTTVDPPVEKSKENHNAEQKYLIQNWPMWILIPAVVLTSILIVPFFHIVWRQCVVSEDKHRRPSRPLRASKPSSIDFGFEHIYPHQIWMTPVPGQDASATGAVILEKDEMTIEETFSPLRDHRGYLVSKL